MESFSRLKKRKVCFGLHDKKKLPEDKKEDQKAVNASLIKSIEGVPDLKAYLAARFSLKFGMKPHELVF
ncbi:hypothetical protein Gotur_003256 [Gossypium turneri]